MTLVSADSVLEDRIAQLNPAVRAKYRVLERERDDFSDAVDGAQRRWEQAREPAYRARIAATAAAERDAHDMGRIARQRKSGKPEPPSPEAAATAARLAQAEEVERARRAAHDDASQRFSTAQKLFAACQALVRSTDNPAQLAPILLTRKAKKPSDVAADLPRLRDGIVQVTAERAALDRAPVPLVEASRRLDDLLDGLAAQWDPPVSAFTRPDFQMPSPEELWPYKPTALAANLPEWRNAYHARLTAAYATQPASVATADRPARAADLVNRQRQLELAEEQILLEAEQAGHSIQRRPDADPLVVLCAVLSA
jgi:hypothetical protein